MVFGRRREVGGGLAKAPFHHSQVRSRGDAESHMYGYPHAYRVPTWDHHERRDEGIAQRHLIGIRLQPRGEDERQAPEPFLFPRQTRDGLPRKATADEPRTQEDVTRF